ncbi:unnamed protein product [Calypogeia fissa]
MQGGRLGGRGSFGIGGRGRAFVDGQGHRDNFGHALFASRSNPLWTEQMEHDQMHTPAPARAYDHMDPLPELSRAHWEHYPESQEVLATIARITAENWSEQEFAECDWDYAEAAYEAKKLKDHAMLCYFTDRPPMLNDFREWIEYEFTAKRGWPVLQVKFLSHLLC